ncbi:XRE family transcriptional regulator [Pseudomonas gingeri]|uniref:XRE family transcriptional regulator n=1 Tax=Pseudomonas gingeri TaxID=117681 RepID=UPI0015BA6A8C|nr:XRE family transcriptional regulator [Pseudomonas gingeri]NWE68975.1 XRE family transcriptional regulator [Pseudomonas gingeri]
MLKSFKERINELKRTRIYCQEQAKLEFVGGITRLMRIKGINNATLAERLESSAAYVTKALRGDTNFTIETMVKVADAMGARIHIHVADAEASVRWLEHMNCSNLDHQPVSRTRPESRDRVDVSRVFDEMQNESREIYA